MFFFSPHFYESFHDATATIKEVFPFYRVITYTFSFTVICPDLYLPSAAPGEIITQGYPFTPQTLPCFSLFLSPGGSFMLHPLQEMMLSSCCVAPSGSSFIEVSGIFAESYGSSTKWHLYVLVGFSCRECRARRRGRRRLEADIATGADHLQ